jgi:hypothetical protein
MKVQIMNKVPGVRIKCPICKTLGDIGIVDGQWFDPPGWVKRGSDTLCPVCTKNVGNDLHPEVLASAEKVVHTIQALIATELSFQPPPGTSITLGSDSVSRRMKRCELLSRYADVIMTVYGNSVGFRLATTGAFGHTTLANVVGACENLLKAEIAFSQARAVKSAHKPTSNFSSKFNFVNDYEYDDGPQIAGPLFRFNEIAKVTQKLAQLIATRAGEFNVTHEDKVLDDAVDGIGVAEYRPMPLGVNNNDGAAIQRQVLMMVQKFVEIEGKKAEARELANNDPPPDPIVELERLLESRAKFVSSGRTLAVKAIDAKIEVIEAQMRIAIESTTVDAALAAEITAKDVTPRAGYQQPPPDSAEIAYLRRTIGDEAVKVAWPKEFEQHMQEEKQA